MRCAHSLPFRKLIYTYTTYNIINYNTYIHAQRGYGIVYCTLRPRIHVLVVIAQHNVRRTRKMTKEIMWIVKIISRAKVTRQCVVYVNGGRCKRLKTARSRHPQGRHSITFLSNTLAHGFSIVRVKLIKFTILYVMLP